METRYVIDAEDRIESFAAAPSEESGETAGDWTGRSLWSLLSGEATRQIYRQLLRRVRAERSAVNFRYRCDVAHQRRWFEMSVCAAAGDRVEFRSRLLSTTPRPPVSWLEQATG